MVIDHLVQKLHLFFVPVSLIMLSRECKFNPKIFAAGCAAMEKLGINVNWKLYKHSECCSISLSPLIQMMSQKDIAMATKIQQIL